MLQIYDENNEQKNLYLRLTPSAFGGTLLAIVDIHGKRIAGGHILRITPAGALEIKGSISPTVAHTAGIRTTSAGSIKICGQ